MLNDMKDIMFVFLGLTLAYSVITASPELSAMYLNDIVFPIIEQMKPVA